MLNFLILSITFSINFLVHSFPIATNISPSKKIVLGTTNAFDTPLYQKAKRVLTSSLAELGYTLTIKTLPNKRSLSWANAGRLDGDLFRVSHLDLKEHPNLQRVNEPLFIIDQSVLSKKNILVNGWDSMKNHTISYERGTNFLDKKQNKFKSVILVNSSEQAIAMVYQDRADITITSRSTGKRILSKNKKFADSIKILRPPLVEITLHVYLNHKLHPKLADKLSLLLKQMKQDGRFEQLLGL